MEGRRWGGGRHCDTEFNYVMMFDPDHKKNPFSGFSEAERVQSEPYQCHHYCRRVL